MQSYLRLQPFAAISFDLDDTLYDNRPILAAAEAKLQDWLAEAFPASQRWHAADWRELKAAVLRQQPELVHDTSASRLQVLTQGLINMGYQDSHAIGGAQAALAFFYQCRSDFQVADEVLALLQSLAERWPLVGITNGNVDEQRIGLAASLKFVLHPGHGLRMKPFPDLFHLAANQLSLPTSQILHVGDHPLTDVAGARLAGCQALWLNPAQGSIPRTVNSLTLLPHGVITHLQQLRQLITN